MKIVKIRHVIQIPILSRLVDISSRLISNFPTGFWSLKVLLGLTLMMLIVSSAACNMPTSTASTQSAIDPLYTVAAQTVYAQYTEIAKPPITTPQPPGGTTVTAPTQITGTVQPVCNSAKFIQDVTIPDNTVMTPGTPFIKTWRLLNSGTCSWTPDYTLVFTNGDQMGGPASVSLTNTTIAPGESVDVSVSLTAPNNMDSFRGEWLLRSPSGEQFGTSPGNNPIWVQIRVSISSGFDFVSRAAQASWVSGIGEDQPDELAFGGPYENPAGVAAIIDNALLENGRNSGKVLLTHPRHEENGYVAGIYEPYMVQSGDRFNARLGFSARSDGSCGQSLVRFQLAYIEGERITIIREWAKSCTGDLLLVDVDLSNLAGRSVRFILAARAEGSYLDDWAIWNSPLIKK